MTTETPRRRRVDHHVEDHFWYVAYADNTDEQGPHVSPEIVLARVLRHMLREDLFEVPGLAEAQPRARDLIVCLEADANGVIRYVAQRLQCAVDDVQSLTLGSYLLRRCLWLLDDQVSTYEHRRTWREIFRVLGTPDTLRKVVEDGF